MLRDLLGPRGPMKAVLVDQRPDPERASRRFSTARTVTGQRHPRFRVERITNCPTQTAPRKPTLVHARSIVAACTAVRQSALPAHWRSAVDSIAEKDLSSERSGRAKTSPMKRACVVGSSDGIGFATAEAL